MKRLLIIAVGAALLQGCVATRVETPSGIVVDRKAFLYPFKTGGFEYNPITGAVTVLDYDTGGGKATAESVVAAAVSAAIKGAK